MRVIKHTQNKLALELHQLDRLTNLSAFLDLADHPTVKPTQLIADIILDCTSIGDIVLAPCLSSGTTLLAAEQTKRRGIGIELDPQYVDVAIRRLQETHGISAIHAETGLSFEDLKTERLSQKEAAHV